MSTIPILQSHVDRIILLGDQLRTELDLQKVTAQWEIDRLREEIQRRNIAILRGCCEAEGITFAEVKMEIPPHECPECFRECNCLHPDECLHDCEEEARRRGDEAMEARIDEEREEIQWQP